jgi:ubiquinone/menaquinone biosynthesis C-methylase UbiE
VTAVAAAYSSVGPAWRRGPDRVYGHLAPLLVDACPGGVAGRTVLDLGAGTGAASRALRDAGAGTIVAVDVALGMVAHGAAVRPPGAVGDALALPFADRACGAVVAAFSLNHLPDPVAGLREAGRVLAPGGGLVASAYAVDDDHPVKGAVTAACVARGWVPPEWYADLQRRAFPQLATVERARAVARRAGLSRAQVDHWRVPVPDLTARDLVEWRFGMAPLAPFVAGLAEDERDALRADALDRLGAEPAPLVRSLIVLTA